MFLYLLSVLFAYYILKPVSRAMFLNRFDIDKLPYLYILMAIGGGILAYAYSRVAVGKSLAAAVFWTMSISVLCLVSIWYLLGMRLPWMIYVLNIFVSLFSVVLVSQGWLVASNLFTTREAKRVYSLLGLGMVAGAAFGGEFTNCTAALVGTRNLLLASAGMIVLAYVAFRFAIAQQATPLSGACAGGEESSFSFGDVAEDIRGSRHLRVLIAMMVITYIVDVLIEYQFQATAKLSFHGDQLTAFFGRFYGVYLNFTEFILQVFVTGYVVSRFGVGGALQVLPASILAASSGAVLAPGITAAAGVRLTEASTRYTVNRTGMELLYLPLPLELRNRIKAFVDIFVDRMSRGLGGILLVVLTSMLGLSVREITVLTMTLTVPWIVLSVRARREYVSTIRRRLAERRLDLDSLRFTVRDPETLALLEQAAAGSNPRQACYALSLLEQAPEYALEPHLENLAASPHPEVRAKVFEIARDSGFTGLTERAARALHSPDSGGALNAAVAYLLAVSKDWQRLAEDLLRSENRPVVAAAMEALASQPERARLVIREEWLPAMLDHEDVAVAAAALRLAGSVGSPCGVPAAMRCLSQARLREAAVEALAAYGPPICEEIGKILEDRSAPAALHRRLPRVLKLIPYQRSVDVLLRAATHDDLAVRAAALKALNRLRRTAPNLNFQDRFITRQILDEARYYYELAAALAPVRDVRGGARTAAGLLVRTLEERLDQCLERLFRLLGLRYPPKEIYSAYLAVSRRQGDQESALEFLENVLDRELRRILIPLLDAPDHVLEHGRDLFGVHFADQETAIAELIESPDSWLAACAIAAAAELGLRNLVEAIADLGRRADLEVSEVARAAESVLAGVGTP